MRRAGTAEFTADWLGDPYAAQVATASGAPYFERMSLFEQAALKALLTKGDAYCQALAAKAEARENKARAKAATATARRPAQKRSNASGGSEAAGQPAPQRHRAHETGALIDSSAVDSREIGRAHV